MNRLGVVVAALVIVLGAAVVVVLTSSEPSDPGELIVGGVDEIKSQGVAYVRGPGIYVVASENGFIALWDDARHVGDRVLYCPVDETFSSPAHGEKFDRQGRYIAGPASGDLGTYPVHVKGNSAVVDVSAGPHLPERSNVNFAHEELSRCQGAEDPPGFYAEGVP